MLIHLFTLPSMLHTAGPRGAVLLGAQGPAEGLAQPPRRPHLGLCKVTLGFKLINFVILFAAWLPVRMAMMTNVLL